MKTGGKAPEAQGGHLPIPIATRSPQKIYLPLKAFKKGAAKLSQQYGIVARGCGKSGIKVSRVNGHPNMMVHEG